MNHILIFLRFSGTEYKNPDKKKSSQPDKEEEERPSDLIWIFPDKIQYNGEPAAA